MSTEPRSLYDSAQSTRYEAEGRRDAVARTGQTLIVSVSALVIGLIALVAPLARRPEPVTPTIEPLLIPLNKRIDSLALTVSVDEWSRRTDEESKHFISLHEETLQSIGDGFLVSQMRINAEPGVARISGLLVNTQAVDQKSASFWLKVRSDSTSVFVADLPAGGSARFTGTRTGVRPDSALFGYMRYANSTVSYHRPR